MNRLILPILSIVLALGSFAIAAACTWPDRVRPFTVLAIGSEGAIIRLDDGKIVVLNKNDDLAKILRTAGIKAGARFDGALFTAAEK